MNNYHMSTTLLSPLHRLRVQYREPVNQSFAVRRHRSRKIVGTMLLCWSVLLCAEVSQAWDPYDSRQETLRRNEAERQQQWKATEDYVRPRRSYETPSSTFGGAGSSRGEIPSEAEFQQWLRTEEHRLEQLRRQGGSRDRQLLEEQFERGQRAWSGRAPTAAYGQFCCDDGGRRRCQLFNTGSQVGDACLCLGQGYGLVCQ